MSECSEVSSTSNKLVLIKGNSVCNFCGSSTDNEVKYGPKYRLEDVTAHYFCVLLSGNLLQEGKDDEGIFGFLLKDIKKELKISADLKCIYCGKNSATVYCSEKNCRKKFHLPCGLKVGTLHLFKKSYNSYCHSHAKLPSIPKKVLREAKDQKLICCICKNTVLLCNKMKYIWVPCCQKNWYHKKCLQKQALSAGYLFKCPTCNNATEFINWVLKFGIYIPQRDASWELVPNAFSELLFTYSRCDAVHCKCPYGRSFSKSESSTWEIILCECCGSQGIHIGCRTSKPSSYDWQCLSCKKITDNLNSKKFEKLKYERLPYEFRTSTQEEFFSRKRARAAEEFENFILDNGKKCKTDVEEDDSEIDVVTVEKSTVGIFSRLAGNSESKLTKEIVNVEEALASIRPGPLSFKLRTIENYWKNQER